VPAGCALDENGVSLSGMGVAVGDFDGDGWLDIARTNFSEQVTTLYRNYGNGAFEDASIRAGLGVNRKYLGFGVGFFDFDNDGWKDLFLANGHVYSQIAARKLHLSYKEPKVLYRNLGSGRFEDVSAKAGPAIRAENLGRGCAFGDFDNDGDVDVIVNNLDGPPSLLRNDGGSGNNWIMIKCVGTRSNRSAIGTRVKVTSSGHSQIDEVMSGSSYYSQNDFRLHFGLGRATKADSVELTWPSGLKESFQNLPANHLFVLQETKGILETRKFG
jgi:enediyne biosynthesis protein E4